MPEVSRGVAGEIMTSTYVDIPDIVRSTIEVEKAFADINAVFGYTDLLDLEVKGSLNADQKAMLTRIRETSMRGKTRSGPSGANETCRPVSRVITAAISPYRDVRDEVRRHQTVIVLTPSRLILAHTDEHAGDDLLPEPYTSTSTEAVSLSTIRSVVVTRMVANPSGGPRPPAEAQLIPETGFSLPSGHTIDAFTSRKVLAPES